MICPTLASCPITGNFSPLFPIKGQKLCKASPKLLLPGPLPIRLFLWLIVWSVFPVFGTTAAYSFNAEVLDLTTKSALAWGQERCVGGWAERVLLQIEQAERKESNPWLKDDYRISWITVKWAQSGVPDWSWHKNSPPHVAATYQVLHCPPDEVWSRIEARRRANLGSEYAYFYPESSSRKKPCATEHRHARRKEAA